MYCDKTRFEGREYQVVFQLRQRPGTYNIGQETVGATERGETIDANFSNDELEYYSNRKGVHKIYRLMVRVIPQKTGSLGERAATTPVPGRGGPAARPAMAAGGTPARAITDGSSGFVEMCLMVLTIGLITLLKPK